jgi:hypothetical protein
MTGTGELLLVTAAGTGELAAAGTVGGGGELVATASVDIEEAPPHPATRNDSTASV